MNKEEYDQLLKLIENFGEAAQTKECYSDSKYNNEHNTRIMAINQYVDAKNELLSHVDYLYESDIEVETLDRESLIDLMLTWNYPEFKSPKYGSLPSLEPDARKLAKSVLIKWFKNYKSEDSNSREDDYDRGGESNELCSSINCIVENVPTSNGKIYSNSVMENIVNEVRSKLLDKKIYITIGRPNSLEIDLSKIAAVVTHIKLLDGKFFIRYVILKDFPMGNILEKLVDIENLEIYPMIVGSVNSNSMVDLNAKLIGFYIKEINEQ